MEITKVSVYAPTKNSALACARVEFKLEGENFTLDDVRIIKAKSGILWVGLPTRNINGTYTQVVFLPPRVKRMIDDAILAEFALWYAARNPHEGPTWSPRSTPAQNAHVETKVLVASQ